jgi:SUKH-3 immunity protein
MGVNSQAALLTSDAEVVDALGRAGWRHDRHVEVGSVLAELDSCGYSSNSKFKELLESISGLKVQPVNEEGPNFVNGEPLTVDPVGVGVRHRRDVETIHDAIGGEWFPIGWWLSYSHVFLGSSGSMVALADGLIWGLGEGVLSGMRLMLLADRPLSCLYCPDGRKAWPRG